MCFNLFFSTVLIMATSPAFPAPALALSLSLSRPNSHTLARSLFPPRPAPDSADMDDAVNTVYQPGTKFVEEKKDSLIDLELTDSTELWLIQWPINQAPDFNGQHVSLKLHGDGHMGAFESSSGKSYEMFSMKSQGAQETVFLNSASEAKIAGKISKHVSLFHYPEPSELQKRNSLNPKRSSMTSSTFSGRRLATPSRSSKPRSSRAMSGYSTPSSRTKSTVSGLGEPSKGSKRKRVDDETRSVDHSAQDSGKTQSAVTSTGSMEQSQETRSKKKKKTEN